LIHSTFSVDGLAWAQTLDHDRVLASVGSVGDADDNALAESFVDSFKTELIADRVWRSRSRLELAVVEYIAWFNNSRLHESLGDIPPVEFEQRHAALIAAISPNPDSRAVAASSPRAAEWLTTRRLVVVTAETARNGANDSPPASPAVAAGPRSGAHNRLLTDRPAALSLRSPSGLALRDGGGDNDREGATTVTTRARKPTKTVPAEPGPAQHHVGRYERTTTENRGLTCQRREGAVQLHSA